MAIKIAYLLNTYPAPSGTFIRNEIAALEDQGLDVTRLAVRQFAGPLVDPADRSEHAKTFYLLDGNIAGLLAAALREILTNPKGLARALPPWWRLLANAREGLPRHIAYLMQAAFLRQFARKNKITHVHSHFSNNAPAVAMLCRLLGGPTYSFTAHGPDEFVHADRLSFPLKIEHAASVVAISNFCRTTLLQLAEDDRFASKIIIARCGLDLDQFTIAPPIGATNQTFVCVGRLCPQKGQVHIPAAVASLREQYPALKVILVGDGESRGEIETEIEAHGVADQVILHGWARGDEVRALIATSRALLLPSYAEGLPVVIMESFALGRPVISTAIAAIPELVDAQCGWLVTPGDHDQLVAAMTAALSSSPATLEAMGQEGRSRVEQHHDRRQLAQALMPHFRDASGQHPA